MIRIYEPPYAAKVLIDQPRFGHNRDFLSILGRKEEREDYITGLIFAGVVAGAFLLLWMVALLMLKYMGSQRVGFLSGHAFIKPAPSVAPQERKKKKNRKKISDDLYLQESSSPTVLEIWMEAREGKKNKHSSISSKDSYLRESSSPSGHEVWIDEKPLSSKGTDKEKKGFRFLVEDKHQGCFWHPSVIRIVFIFSGAMFIISSFLMVIKGINNLQATTVTLNNSAEAIHDIAAAVERIHQENFAGGSDLELKVREAHQELIDEFSDTSQLCPRDPSMVSAIIARRISSRAAQASVLLEDVDKFLIKEADETLELSQKVQAASKQVQDVTAVEFKGWSIVVVFIMCMLVPALLLLSAGLALAEISIPCYSVVTNWLLLPLFILAVVACSVLQGVTGIVAGINSDACLPGGQPFPDDTVFGIVQNVGFTADSDVYKVVNWYASQCDADGSGRENPLQTLEDFQPILETGKETVDQLYNTIFNDKVLGSQLLNECGRSFAAWEPRFQNLRTLLFNLDETLQQILTLFRCEDIVAIYTAIVYDGACTYSIEAIVWIYCSALAMAFFGMLMITFRASCKQTEDQSICDDNGR